MVANLLWAESRIAYKIFLEASTIEKSLTYTFEHTSRQIVVFVGYIIFTALLWRRIRRRGLKKVSTEILSLGQIANIALYATQVNQTLGYKSATLTADTNRVTGILSIPVVLVTRGWLPRKCPRW